MGKAGHDLQVTHGVRASSPRRSLNPAKRHKYGVRAHMEMLRQLAAAFSAGEEFLQGPVRHLPFKALVINMPS